VDRDSVTALASRLAAVLGDAAVVRDRERLASYETDWTGRFTGTASLVLMPTTTAEVSAVMRLCHEAGAPVVAQGGNTGLVGGGVPRSGEIVLSLARMRSLDSIDAASAQVTVEAGVTLATLQRHARDEGFDVGVDFAACDSATIGGIAATDAGGRRVVRHGTTRRQVVGIEAVLANGDVLTWLTGLRKDNVGYDLCSVLVGSEGTLAIITRVRFRLVPIFKLRATAILGLESLGDAVAVLSRLKATLTSLESAEIFFDDGLAVVCAHKGLARPLAATCPVYLLVECADHSDPSGELLTLIGEQPEIKDVAVAMDARGRARLWSYRESHTEAVNALGVPVRLDVAIPMVGVADFESKLRKLCAASHPDWRLILFGHLAEGNFHVNLIGALNATDDDVVADVLRLVPKCDGRIGAEHGIGQAKRSWIHLSWSGEEIQTMLAIKQALDPEGILNPGVIFDRAVG
jgi:FAD/FMN-containing dehydrogenase